VSKIISCLRVYQQKPFLLLGGAGLVFLAFLLHFSIKGLILSREADFLKSQNYEVALQLNTTKEQLEELRSQDQFLINKELQEEIKNINKNYLKTVDSYGDLLDLKTKSSKTEKLDVLFADILKYLAARNYASAAATLTDFNNKIMLEEQKLASVVTIPASVPQSNIPPSVGYSRQKVQTDAGEFMVSLVSADLNSTRVVVDTASEQDCNNDCPVLSLSEYISRNGAFAGVNGSYFCPATYPQCADKKNAFDTLLMNKNKRYFNSDNNVYSVNPAVIFSGNSARFVQKTLEWGRDAGVDAVISNYPLLVYSNAIVFEGDSDAKHNSKGGRSFVGVTGSTVYIGVVHNATVLESAKTLYVLGIHNAMNLDDGGSTALWYSGYKVGPGRNLPNALLLVRK